MRIIVPIKQVPETSNVKMDPVTGTMIRGGVEAIINPLDLYALEMALRMKELYQATISVITMGPGNAEAALREALALGCDDAVLLSHKSFGGADTWATSYTLSQAIRKMGDFDFILCGERATDGETGQVGPEIAAFLGVPLLTYVRRVFDLNDGSVRAERMVEGGVERLKTRLPVVMTVIKDAGNPRLPTLRGMQQAKAKTIPVWGPDEIGANPEWIGLKGSPTRVVKICSPQVSRKGNMITAKTPEEMDIAADKLIDFLKQKSLLA